jgi:hypothetical protein
MKSKLPAETLGQLLRKSLFDPGVCRVLQQLGEEPEVCDMDFEPWVFHCYHQNGIEIGCKGAEQTIISVHFYGPRIGGAYVSYSGQLPDNLNFGESMKSIELRLGLPPVVSRRPNSDGEWPSLSVYERQDYELILHYDKSQVLCELSYSVPQKQETLLGSTLDLRDPVHPMEIFISREVNSKSAVLSYEQCLERLSAPARHFFVSCSFVREITREGFEDFFAHTNEAYLASLPAALEELGFQESSKIFYRAIEMLTNGVESTTIFQSIKKISLLTDEDKKRLLNLDEDFRKHVTIKKDFLRGQENCFKRAKSFLKKHENVNIIR